MSRKFFPSHEKMGSPGFSVPTSTVAFQFLQVHDQTPRIWHSLCPRRAWVRSGDSNAEVLEAASHCPLHWVVFYPVGSRPETACLPE